MAEDEAETKVPKVDITKKRRRDDDAMKALIVDPVLIRYILKVRV